MAGFLGANLLRGDIDQSACLGAGYHRWPGEVLEQSAGDDPGMDKIMACAGSLYPDDQKASPPGLGAAAASIGAAPRRQSGPTWPASSLRPAKSAP